MFPVCDNSVSGKIFQLWECVDCRLRFTQDVPEQDAIGPFYKSSNYISHSNTRTGLINSLYHRVRGITLKSKRQLIQASTGLRKGHLLDIGCGTGAFLNEMKQAGWAITGIEPDPIARANASSLFSIDALPPEELNKLPKGGFQAITLWHVLEHVHDLHNYLNTIFELLAPGGKLFIAVPNYTSFDARYYREFWAAYDVPRHLYHFSPGSMLTLLDKHSLEVSSIKPMWFDSYYVSMLSEKYRKQPAGLFWAVIIGAYSNFKALFNRKKCSSLIYVAGKR